GRRGTEDGSVFSIRVTPPKPKRLPLASGVQRRRRRTTPAARNDNARGLRMGPVKVRLPSRRVQRGVVGLASLNQCQGENYMPGQVGSRGVSIVGSVLALGDGRLPGRNCCLTVPHPSGRARGSDGSGPCPAGRGRPAAAATASGPRPRAWRPPPPP